jgi:protein-export membrane protein SecD
MTRRRSYAWPVLTVVIAVLVVTIALPQQWRSHIPLLNRPALHLGLDLAGGTQLDFRISEEEINQQLKDVDAQIATLEKSGTTGTGSAANELISLRNEKTAIQSQQSNLVEAIRGVLERRINSLGVSEATITPSYIGNEKHLLVECPGVVDTQQCINVVGKTIQLEFKEQFTEATEDFTKGVRAKSTDAFARLQRKGSGATTLQKEGQDLGTQLGVSYSNGQTLFKDELPEGLGDLWTMQPGQVVQRDGSVMVPQQDAKTGQTVDQKVPGIFIAEVVKPLTMTGRTVNTAEKAFQIIAKTETGASYAFHKATAMDAKVDARVASTLKDMQAGSLKSVTLGSGAAVLFSRSYAPGGEQVEASHILVSYKGATGAAGTVTRTKEQAMARAKDLKAQLAKGAKFEDLAKAQSDGPSAKDGGRLGAISRNTMAPAFEQFAFGGKQGQVSDVLDTAFGYDIVRVDKAKFTTPAVADYDQLTLAGKNAPAKATELIAKMQAGQIKTTEQAVVLRTLFFSLLPTGWKDTQLNGKHFRTAAVSLDPVTSVPVVQITFDAEGAKLFQELTKKNIGKPIAIFVGGELVSAPTVQAEISGGNAVITGSRDIDEAKKLAQDLNTGAIPAPIHLTGQYTIEATLGANALHTSLMAAFLGIAVLMIYMILVYRLLGLIADIALTMYAFLLFAILKLPLFLLSNNYIVMTLAGMAGIILSIGMAVDANVLVFERMKEELRKGKMVKTSVESSFKHAWPAIRDGNVSTLITCAILFLIGTSIVRGFAVTLGMGTILSMFTAFVISRWMLRKVSTLKVAENTALFGVSRAENQKGA